VLVVTVASQEVAGLEVSQEAVALEV